MQSKPASAAQPAPSLQVQLATRLYARTVGAGRPLSSASLMRLAVRLSWAAAWFLGEDEPGYATFCADRARDCVRRAASVEHKLAAGLSLQAAAQEVARS